MKNINAAPINTILIAAKINNQNNPSHQTNGVKNANHKYLTSTPNIVTPASFNPRAKRLFKYNVENPTIGENVMNHSVRPDPVQKWTFCNLYNR